MAALGTVGIADKGVYNPTETYKKGNFVLHNDSTWLVLANEITGVTPVDDGVNWKYLAKGASILTDTEGLLGTVGASVSNQDLVDELSSQLINMKIVNVKNFGAKGDGVADDTVAIQSALNTFGDAGGVMVIPPGIYNISSPINASNKGNITIKGYNGTSGSGHSAQLRATTEIHAITAGMEACFLFTSINRLEITGLFIDCKNKAYNGIKLIGIYQNKIHKNVCVNALLDTNDTSTYKNTGIGINISYITTGIYYNRIEENSLVYNGYAGLKMLKVNDGWISKNVIGWNGDLSSTGAGGVVLLNCGTNIIVNNRIEQNQGYGISGYDALSNGTIGAALLNSNHFDCNYWSAVMLNTPTAWIISGNYFFRNGAALSSDSDKNCHLYTSDSSRCNIASNKFNYGQLDGAVSQDPYFPTYGIYANNSYNMTITANNLYDASTSDAILLVGTKSRMQLIGNLGYTYSIALYDNTSALRNALDTTTLYLDGMKMLKGSAAPTSGTWARGDVVYNSSPSAGGYEKWICVGGGTPGTWKRSGLIES